MPSVPIIGGMPEIVREDIKNGNLAALTKVYESIWGTYKNDVEKYATGASKRRVIKHIISVAHLYVDQRIKFQNFGNSNYKSREVGEAMRNLDAAKIIQLIYPTTDIAPPIIPHLITQEVISLNTITDSRPHFWVRDKTQSSSEVDMVYRYGDKIIPIEIKSGATGTLKSLHQFINRADHPYAIRIYAGKFNVARATTLAGTPYLLMNLPYFLGTQLPRYIDYFVNNYSLSSSVCPD